MCKAFPLYREKEKKGKGLPSEDAGGKLWFQGIHGCRQLATGKSTERNIWWEEKSKVRWGCSREPKPLQIEIYKKKRKRNRTVIKCTRKKGSEKEG